MCRTLNVSKNFQNICGDNLKLTYGIIFLGSGSSEYIVLAVHSPANSAAGHRTHLHQAKNRTQCHMTAQNTSSSG